MYLGMEAPSLALAVARAERHDSEPKAGAVDGVEPCGEPGAETSGISNDDDREGGSSPSCACTPAALTVSLLSLTTMLLFADQNLMAPNLTQIADDFGFNEAERDQKLGGNVALAFFVVGGAASLLVGALTDRPDLGIKRRDLYATVVVVGEGACAATALASEYWHLLLLRALTGFSVGGALPLLFSMFGDLFPPAHRTHVSAVVGAAMGLGVILGQEIAAAVGTKYGWRAPFAVVGLPAVACALALRGLTDEPERGAAEPCRRPAGAGAGRTGTDGSSDGAGAGVGADVGKKDNEKLRLVIADSASSSRLSPAAAAAAASPPPASALAKMRVLLRTKTVCLIYLQGIPGCVPWGVINVYLNDYLSQQKGLSVAQATSLLVAFGAGSVGGGILGGLWGQALYNRDKRWQPLLMGASTTLGAAPMMWLIAAPPGQPFNTVMLPLFLASGAVVSITGANVRAVLLNVTAPEVRGWAFSVFNLMDDLGKGVGPVLVSSLIAVYGRETTFVAAMLAWVPCGLLLAAIACTVESDEEMVQRRMLYAPIN